MKPTSPLLSVPALLLALTACGGSSSPEAPDPTAAPMDDVCSVVTAKGLAEVGLPGHTVAEAEVDEDGEIACEAETEGDADAAVEWTFTEPTVASSLPGSASARHEAVALGSDDVAAYLFTDELAGIPQASVVLPVSGKLLTVEASSDGAALGRLSTIATTVAEAYAGATIIWPKETVPAGPALTAKKFCDEVTTERLTEAAGDREYAAIGYGEDGPSCAALPVGEPLTYQVRWRLDAGQDLAAVELPPTAKDVTVAGQPAREAAGAHGVVWLATAAEDGILFVTAMDRATARTIAEAYAG